MPYKLTPSEEKQERMFARMRIVLALRSRFSCSGSLLSKGPPLNGGSVGRLVPPCFVKIIILTNFSRDTTSGNVVAIFVATHQSAVVGDNRRSTPAGRTMVDWDRFFLA
jgi:hypothetical protein